MNYYKIHFKPYDATMYLGWGHGEFLVVKSSQIACILTDKSIKYNEVVDYLKALSREYQIERCDENTVKSIRIYE